MDNSDDIMSPEERRSRRLARLERSRRRRRRNITIFAAATVIVVVLLVLLGPWGPLGGMIFGKSGSESKAGSRNPGSKAGDSKKNPVRGKTGDDSGAQTERKPAQPAHAEKKSNPTPPAVAIVVDDVGNTTEKLPLWLQIDAPLSFSAMPYPPLSQSLAEEFYKGGYQVMMHIPTQNEPPNSFSGNGQLEVGMSRETVFATLDADLAAVPHVTGINNHQGGLGCDNLELMTYECEWAKQHGFYVADSNSSYHSEVSKAAVALGMGRKKNQVFIDHQNEPDYIRGAMRELAGLARQNGFAIGICHYHRPNTAAVVGEMVNTLKAEGINFAFARDINN